MDGHPIFYSWWIPATPASTTQNIGCPSIMTPSKMGKTKNLIFYSLTLKEWNALLLRWHQENALAFISMEQLAIFWSSNVLRGSVTWNNFNVPLPEYLLHLIKKFQSFRFLKRQSFFNSLLLLAPYSYPRHILCQIMIPSLIMNSVYPLGSIFSSQGTIWHFNSKL